MPEQRRQTASIVPSPGSTVRVVRNSAVMYQLGGRSYAMKTVPTCKVCNHPDRVSIERMAIRGLGPTAVHRALSEQAQDALTVRNIMDHNHAHLPVDHLVRQAMMEAHAREIGLDPETTTETLVDSYMFARVGLQKVFERMADGEIKPGISDGVAFAQLLMRMDEMAGESVDQDMMARGFMVYMAAMRQVCTPEQIRQMGEIIAADPVMQALLAQSERIGHEVVEVTV